MIEWIFPELNLYLTDCKTVNKAGGAVESVITKVPFWGLKSNVISYVSNYVCTNNNYRPRVNKLITVNCL